MSSSPDPRAIAPRIRAFLASRIGEADASAIRDDEDLGLAGVPSIDIVTLVADVEAAFGVTVTEDDFFSDEVASIASLSRFVAASRRG